MANRSDLILDMTPAGEFRDSAANRRLKMPFSVRLKRTAVILALMITGVAVAVLTFWFALILVSVAFALGLVAWAAFRFHLWRSGVALR